MNLILMGLGAGKELKQKKSLMLIIFHISQQETCFVQQCKCETALGLEKVLY